jgi:hypothetical protein
VTNLATRSGLYSGGAGLIVVDKRGGSQFLLRSLARSLFCLTLFLVYVLFVGKVDLLKNSGNLTPWTSLKITSPTVGFSIAMFWSKMFTSFVEM